MSISNYRFRISDSGVTPGLVIADDSKLAPSVIRSTNAWIFNRKKNYQIAKKQIYIYNHFVSKVRLLNYAKSFQTQENNQYF